MTPIRILMATDVPFWRAETGAQQRILHLVDAISKHVHQEDASNGNKNRTNAFEIKTFYVQPLEPRDQKLIQQHLLDVEVRTSDDPPKGLVKTLKWRIDGTIHLANRALESISGNEEEKNRQPSPVSLDDFRWPWAIDAFKDSVNTFSPNVILCQYITLGYLLESLSESQRKSILCVVDTHDILSSRCAQFRQHGYPHWIEIDPEQEALALAKFDTAIAIHEAERKPLSKLAPQTNIVVAGHSIEKLLVDSKRELANRELTNSGPTNNATDPTKSSDLLRVGYLGSANYSNEHALGQLIEEVILPIQKLTPRPAIEFIIAGSICGSGRISEQLTVSSCDPEKQPESRSGLISVLGKVDSIEDFYSRVDVVINPVTFGTGLKIKNCEAFAFGKPSIVTRNGADALPESAGSALIVVEDVCEIKQAIVNLAEDPVTLNFLQTAARQLAQKCLCDSVVYAELFSILLDPS